MAHVFFFQAEDGIRDWSVTGVQTCALPISLGKVQARAKATDWLAIRATASTGFHAPTPGQGNVETISTTFLPGSTNNVQIRSEERRVGKEGGAPQEASR